MPNDSRRLPVPDVSLDPLLYTSNEKHSSDLVDENGYRSDSRNTDDLREMFLQCGLITQAKGSSYCEMGNTKVVCAVYGPRDIEQRDEFQMKGKIKCDLKFAPFSCKKRKQHVPSMEEEDMSDIVTQALTASVCLHRFPKSQIDVYITVLDNDGSVLSAALMAASLALADACIDMYDIITACTVRVNGKDSFLIDPTALEEYEPRSKGNDQNNGLITVALLPTINQVSALLSVGSMKSDVVSSATETCISYAQYRYTDLRKCLIESNSNTFSSEEAES